MKNYLFLIFLFVLVCILTFINNVPDFDLWARLSVGSIVFQTDHVLNHDIFSYVPTKTWIDHEWGSGVVFYAIVKWFGDGGIFILKGIILIFMFLYIFKLTKYKAGISYFILISVAMFPGIHSIMRCQMFTYIFFILWVYLLENIRENGRKLIGMFPFTFLFWINLHGGFVSGLGLVFLYYIFDKNQRKVYLEIFLMLALVMLLTPYGINYFPYLFSALTMSRPYITEWHSANLLDPMLVGVLIFVLLTVIVHIKKLKDKERIDMVKLLTASVLLCLGLWCQRNIIFFVLYVSSLFYNDYILLFSKKVRLYLNRLSYVVLSILLIVLIPKFHPSLIVDPKVYPVGSFEFIKQNNIKGNLATTFEWGSYALWKLQPQCKVLIDGRYEEVYPDSVFNEAILLSTPGADWSNVLYKYPTDIIVLSKKIHKDSELELLPGWLAVYQDTVSVVLLPKSKISNYAVPIYNSKENYSKSIVLEKGF